MEIVRDVIVTIVVLAVLKLLGLDVLDTFDHAVNWTAVHLQALWQGLQAWLDAHSTTGH